MVKIWDIRQNTQFMDSYAASPSQELTYLDWHPTVPDVVLTSSMDCNILARKLDKKDMLFRISTAEPVIKASWIPGQDYMVASIKQPLNKGSCLNVWHAVKPNVPQYLIDYQNYAI